MALPRFRLNQTAVLLVDVQERLTPLMHNAESLVRQCGRLLDGAHALGASVLVTEQYRQGLGPTVPELAKRIDGALCNHDKMLFSACIEPIREQLVRQSVRSVIVCGLEAHVCVLQTCLDLMDIGYVTAVALDAVGSRRVVDQDAAVRRMIQAGVVPTTVEGCLLELTREAGTEQFKQVLPVVRPLD